MLCRRSFLSLSSDANICVRYSIRIALASELDKVEREAIYVLTEANMRDMWVHSCQGFHVLRLSIVGLFNLLRDGILRKRRKNCSTNTPDLSLSTAFPKMFNPTHQRLIPSLTISSLLQCFDLKRNVARTSYIGRSLSSCVQL